jgi:hypothetical protein
VTARALLVPLALLVAGCTSDDAGPPPTTRATTSTTVVDRSGVVLPGVGGETTTTIDDTGSAALVGTVRGPAGPLAGATVRIDRLVGGHEVRHDVRTAADGRWELRGVPGGRYRVRAFLAPAFAQTAAEARFLADGEEHSFDLVVDDQRGVVVRADVAPDQPTLDAAVNLVVYVVQRTVAADGVVRSTPVSGTVVELSGLGRWVLRDDSSDGGSTDDGSTDDTSSSTTSTTFVEPPSPSVALSSGGRARFELVCVRTGASGLTLRVPVVVRSAPGSPPPASPTTSTTEPQVTVESVALELPACIDPRAATTTTTTAP